MTSATIRPVVLCEIVFLPHGEGGRRTPPNLAHKDARYRPHLVVEGRDGTIETEFLGVEFQSLDSEVEVGRPVEVSVELIYHINDINYAALEPGAQFDIVEGQRVVGSGRVLRWLEHVHVPTDQRAEHDAFSIFAALLISALAPASVGWLLGMSPLIVTFVVAFAHAIIFGLPLYLAFRRTNGISAITCSASGFLIGALPIGFLIFPHGDHSAWSDGVPTVVNGVLTFAGWRELLLGSGIFGLFGALGGFVFFWLLSDLKPQEPDAARDRQGS